MVEYCEINYKCIPQQKMNLTNLQSLEIFKRSQLGRDIVSRQELIDIIISSENRSDSIETKHNSFKITLTVHCQYNSKFYFDST